MTDKPYIIAKCVDFLEKGAALLSSGKGRGNATAGTVIVEHIQLKLP